MKIGLNSRISDKNQGDFMNKITIGVFDDGECRDINFVINSILGQDYPCIELVIVVNKYSNICVGDVADLLRINRKDNIISVILEYTKKNLSIAEQIKFIIEKSTGNYIMFLPLSDSLYDSSVLSNVETDFLKTANIIFAKTANYIDDNYNKTEPTDIENVTVENINNYSKSIFLRLEIVKKHIAVEGNMFYDLINLLRNIYQNQFSESIIYSNKVIIKHNTFIKHCEQTSIKNYFYKSQIINESKLNYSRSIHIIKLIEYLKNNKTKRVTERLVSEIQQIVIKQRDGYWPLTASDKLYISYITRIIECINLDGENSNKHLNNLKKEIDQNINNKIKIVFFANEFSVWMSLSSVYKRSLENEYYEAQLVYIPFNHGLKIENDNEIEKYKNEGYKIVNYLNYNISKESPDVVVYVKPYDLVPDGFKIRDVDKVVRRCVYIPYGMEIGNNNECLNYQCRSAMQVYAWKALAYGKDYYNKMVLNTYTRGENYIRIGHPRMDLRNKNKLDNVKCQEILQKAKGKTIVLWNTHFTIEEGDSWGTFLQNGKTILDFFTVNSKFMLIWRPHPLFYSALAKHTGKNLNEIMIWFEELSDNKNIWIDKESDYLISFKVSDILISDMSSFVPEFLSWGKKVIVTRKRNSSGMLLNSIDDYFTYVDNNQELENILNNLELGNFKLDVDEKLLEDNFYLSPKKTVAERLLSHIKNEIDVEESII